MRIAQIAPLAESCPPRFYGGTERIVSYLAEELVAQGHEVTLFATGDSETRAELVPCVPSALRLNAAVRDTIPYHMLMLDRVLRRAREFDVLHFHIDLLHFPAIQKFAGKTLTTLHGRLDLPDLQPFYSAFVKPPLASISYSQRTPLAPGANWAGNVYHGLPRGLLPFSRHAEGGYLAFLGRISPEKRPDRAIEIAARAGLPLRIAAKIDSFDQGYWLDVIRPMAEANPSVEYRWRNRRKAESGLSGQCPGAPVPYRLAGTFRAGHDRSDGMRDACYRVRARGGFRNCQRGGNGVRGAKRRGSGGGSLAGSPSQPGAGSRRLRAPLYSGADGGRLSRYLPLAYSRYPQSGLGRTKSLRSGRIAGRAAAWLALAQAARFFGAAGWKFACCSRRQANFQRGLPSTPRRKSYAHAAGTERTSCGSGVLATY